MFGIWYPNCVECRWYCLLRYGCPQTGKNLPESRKNLRHLSMRMEALFILHMSVIVYRKICYGKMRFYWDNLARLCVFCFVCSWNNLWRDFISEEIVLVFKRAGEEAGRPAIHSGLENWNPNVFYCSPFLLWWWTMASLFVKPLTPVKITWEDSTPVRWHLAFSEDSVVVIDTHIMRAISQERSRETSWRVFYVVLNPDFNENLLRLSISFFTLYLHHCYIPFRGSWNWDSRSVLEIFWKQRYICKYSKTWNLIE
jgi:hypothetical protein